MSNVLSRHQRDLLREVYRDMVLQTNDPSTLHKLRRLEERGFVERHERGWWTLTDKTKHLAINGRL